ncbi:uncharacterized protein LOC110708114 [Chenopodium quinoa]|uniref:uncharacterized protein LOC110708114 n=1 Tax=Chenopodium quinoa TaxID=63459 RepID=UPI000B77D976|nr:uncharacterized protein LOC110708114 [Chenopodium quinoa]
MRIYDQIPTPADFVKINCDVCLKTDGWIGLRVAARNVAGEVPFAGVRQVRGFWPPEVAECRALLFGVKLALKYGYKKVILESDCQHIITRLSKASTFLTDLDSVFNDIFSICSSFDYVHWSYVKRDESFIAHHLASVVLFSSEQVWENFCPSVISPYVLMDKLSND